MRFTPIILALYFAALTIPNITIFLDESTPESLEFKNKLHYMSNNILIVVFSIIGFSLLSSFKSHFTKGIQNTFIVFSTAMFLTGLTGLTSRLKYYNKWLLALLLLILEIAQMYALSLLLQKTFPFEHRGMYHLHSL